MSAKAPARVRATFTVEIDFDAPIEGEELRRYVCTSIEEGITLLWHDYMVNIATVPKAPMRVCCRWTKDAALKARAAGGGG